MVLNKQPRRSTARLVVQRRVADGLAKPQWQRNRRIPKRLYIHRVAARRVYGFEKPLENCATVSKLFAERALLVQEVDARSEPEEKVGRAHARGDASVERAAVERERVHPLQHAPHKPTELWRRGHYQRLQHADHTFLTRYRSNPCLWRRRRFPMCARNMRAHNKALRPVPRLARHRTRSSNARRALPRRVDCSRRLLASPSSCGCCPLLARRRGVAVNLAAAGARAKPLLDGLSAAHLSRAVLRRWKRNLVRGALLRHDLVLLLRTAQDRWFWFELQQLEVIVNGHLRVARAAQRRCERRVIEPAGVKDRIEARNLRACRAARCRDTASKTARAAAARGGRLAARATRGAAPAASRRVVAPAHRRRRVRPRPGPTCRSLLL